MTTSGSAAHKEGLEMYENLKKEMNRAGITESDVALVANTTEEDVHKWLEGNNQPSIEQAVAIAHSLLPGYKLEYLFSQDDHGHRSADTNKSVDDSLLKLADTAAKLHTVANALDAAMEHLSGSAGEAVVGSMLIIEEAAKDVFEAQDAIGMAI